MIRVLYSNDKVERYASAEEARHAISEQVCLHGILPEEVAELFEGTDDVVQYFDCSWDVDLEPI